ncbi:hypothetical protein NS220_10650 [Microbacterium testaceum]|uniref:Ketoreductase domain-containing protein n=1 Tax=Microbacterium testaceum TaxID=2033 RepID=A0A147EWA3_MICTE|nr:SDR family oxidoreductase [Microbacterium testaceum]KTR93935.1 hypothetical protein NS220_10650 [Microbacterium testaceum]
MARTSPVALVTGASGGIGSTVARALAEEGYAVAVAYGRGAEAAERVVAEIEARGGTARAFPADLADASSLAALFDAVIAAFGGIDVVVHAAAAFHKAPIVDTAPETIDEIVLANIAGTLHLARLSALHVRDGGAIVFVSSAITRLLPAGYTLYATSKAAVDALTTVLARELGARRITVNAVSPGPTRTAMMTADLTAGGDPDAQGTGILAATPLGRFGEPDDISAVILGLLEPTRWVNGQTIQASGGFV